MNVPILVYHEIGEQDNRWCVSPENFQNQMEYLYKNEYKTISLDDIEILKTENLMSSDQIIDKKMVAITFDDARRGIYDFAFPILKKYGFIATIFIVSDWANGKRINANEQYSEVLHWKELTKLKDAKFKFGSHTKTHTSLFDLTDSQIEDELKLSRDVINRELGINVNCFSYPYGKYTKKIEQIAGRYYRSMCTMDNGINKMASRLSRRTILNSTSLIQFSKLLNHSISLCMITKNEEGNLSRCLDSVKEIIDEIIIVDTGSTDQTIKIAQGFNAKISTFEWRDDFSAARNESIKHATSDWIFVIDGDEVLDDSTFIKNILGNADGYIFTTKNFTNDTSVANFKRESIQGFKGWFPSRKVRLFRRANWIFFEGRVHENVDNRIRSMGGTIEFVNNFVSHFGRGGKENYYQKLGKLKAEEDGSAKSFLELGIHNKEIGKYNEAIEAFDKAIEVFDKENQLDNGLAISYFNRAIVHDKLTKSKQAILDLNEAVKLKNNYGEAYFTLGNIYLRQNNLDKAQENFDNAIKYDPSNTSSFLNLGAVFERKGQYPQAIMMLVKSIALYDKNPKPFHNLGVVFEKMGQYNKARVALNQAKKLGFDSEKISIMLKELDEKERGSLSFGIKGQVN